MEIQHWLGQLLSFFIGVASSVAAAYIISRSRNGALLLLRLLWLPHQLSHKISRFVLMKSPTTTIEDLWQLKRLLLSINSWIEHRGDWEILDDMNRSIWNAYILLDRDIYAHLSIYSDDQDQQIAAFDKLAQLDPIKAKAVIGMVSSLKIVSVTVKQEMLKRLPSIEWRISRLNN